VVAENGAVIAFPASGRHFRQRQAMASSKHGTNQACLGRGGVGRDISSRGIGLRSITA
jgi:hypothetical protein